jgi:hypothetical protein
MQILSRLPNGRGNAPYLVGTTMRARRPSPATERSLEREAPLDGIAPARGIAIAIGAGLLCWAALITQLARV